MTRTPFSASIFSVLLKFHPIESSFILVPIYGSSFAAGCLLLEELTIKAETRISYRKNAEVKKIHDADVC